MPVSLAISFTQGIVPANTQGSPAANTPAARIFGGFVDFQGSPNSSIDLVGNGVVTYLFSGLDPAKRYAFRGSAIRGNATYGNRWALCEISGADFFTNAHSANILTTARIVSLTAAQAALNSGINHTASTGDVVGWDEIDPGSGGIFEVRCRQYTGAIPGGTANGPRGYALTGLRLEEVVVAKVPVAIQTPVTDRSVGELRPTVFSVGATGNPRPSYQWYRNEYIIPNATNAVFGFARVLLSDNQVRFKVVVSNTSGPSAESSGLLTVVPDVAPPVLAHVQTIGLSRLRAVFSEGIRSTEAEEVSNYSITGGATVASAHLESSGTSVLLTTSPLTEGASYTLTVNQIADLSAAANRIRPGAEFSFVAVSYESLDVGSPAMPGSLRAARDGYDVTAGGSGIGAGADEFQFGSQEVQGDFDFKVPVDSIELSSVWAKAGLMARESADARAAFAAVFSAPTISGAFFESRAVSGRESAKLGSFPANFPHGWLRLKRAGSEFTGFAGADGLSWTRLGAVTLELPRSLRVGMAVTGQDGSRTTLARLRELSPVAGGEISHLHVDREPLGPSSRKTGLVITEIMYKPASQSDGRQLEFIEILNSNPFPEDIGRYRLAGDVDYVFPENTSIPGGGLIVIAKAPKDIEAHYGISNVFGPYSGSLKVAGTVRLRNQIGAIYLEVSYSNRSPWPVAADGTGHSLVLARPSFGEGYARAWDISGRTGGSPGAVDGISSSPLESVVINEFLAHADLPLTDYVELYNHGNSTVDLSGCVLTDDASTNKCVMPPGTSIPQRGFLAFSGVGLCFSLSSSGETVYFKNPDGTRVIDAIRYEGQEHGISSGRHPDGAAEFFQQSARTPGGANTRPKFQPVVINELMYKPISGSDDDQFVELHNTGSELANLAGWRLEDGVDFEFPPGTTIPAGGFLVVAKNQTNLLAKYPRLDASAVVGDFAGRLSGKGERLALAKPEARVSQDARSGVSQTNIFLVVVDELTFSNGGRWGNWANGGGSSLELIDPRSDRRLASNWADSDESSKSAWTQVEGSGVLDLGSSYASGQTATPINRLEVSLFGEGECLVDNVEVINASGQNLVSNSTFEPGLSGWTPQGNHVRSTLEAREGFESGQSLHVRASSRGDPGPNRIRTALTSPLAAGQRATFRAKVRWLRGWPEILLRIKGNYLDAVGRLAVPHDLGSPGARNSRARENAAPAIHGVRHHPVVPSAQEAVTVTARVDDPDGVGSAELFYRLDPSATLASVVMRDDGTGGDAVADDGVFSAVIPGQNTGVLAAFHVKASDRHSSPAAASFPDDAPARECLVRFGDPNPSTSFGVYRQWFTQAAINSWISRPVLSNERVEGTFVYGNFRAVYNFGSRFAGSPYHQNFSSPLGNCHYSIEMPLDDLVLGTENFNKVHAPGNGPFDDNTSQRGRVSRPVEHIGGLVSAGSLVDWSK